MNRETSQQLAEAQKAQSFSPFNARNRFSFFGDDETTEEESR